MTDLQKYREEIDRIDDEMADLFQKRMETVQKIVQYKIDNNISTRDASREQQVIDMHLDQITPPYKESYCKFMLAMFEISRSYQNDTREKD